MVLPILPRRLGILTSSAGTVINDFRSSLDAGKFGFELFWRHSAMQGLEAKPQILAGLKALSEFPGLDAILVFRGGGSAAELAIFNDYEIARAVCLAPVPVISAIGHQEDQCSVQDVSFRGLGVPKDVGRFFADIVIERRRSFGSFCERFSGLSGALADQTAHRFRLLVQTVRAGAQSALDRPAQFIAGILQQLPVLIARNIAERSQRMSMICGAISPLVERSCDHGAVAVKGAADRLARQVRQQHDRAAYSVRLELDRLAAGKRMAEIAAERVAGFERLFEQVSPERQLKRGFAMVRRTGGEFVLHSGGVAAGDEVEIEFHDGSRSAKISK